METATMTQLFERVITPVDTPTIEHFQRVIADATRLEGVLAATKTQALEQLAALTPQAEDIYAAASRESLHQADRVWKRAQLLGNVSALADRFATGDLSAQHVDAFATIYRQAKPAIRQQLAGHADELADYGAGTTAYELRKRVAALVRDLEDKGDAEQKLARQKRATRLKVWVDPETGMGRLNGFYDPETWRTLHGRIVQEAETRFHGLTPEHCPDDPQERQQFLRAHLATNDGQPGTSSPAEVVVVHHHPDRQIEIDWGVEGIELPTSSLEQILQNRARIYNVHIRTGEILSAPGQLNLGRTSRLANRAQRRALAAIHKTCCYPGCETRYWQTKLHHIRYWRHGGLTDLANLIPLCSTHHARVHTQNLTCTLRSGRKVTFTQGPGPPE
jgi:hypothetical protein